MESVVKVETCVFERFGVRGIDCRYSQPAPEEASRRLNSDISKTWVCHALSRRAKNGPKSDIFGTPRARLLSRSTSTWVGGVTSQMGRWMTVLDFVADDEFDVLAEIRRSRPVWGFDAHNPKFNFFDHHLMLYCDLWSQLSMYMDSNFVEKMCRKNVSTKCVDKMCRKNV